MITERPELTLEHLLRALESELLDAPDDEILAAAHELGMNPSMRASAAFMGVKFLFDPRTTHFGNSSHSEDQSSLTQGACSGDQSITITTFPRAR